MVTYVIINPGASSSQAWRWVCFVKYELAKVLLCPLDISGRIGLSDVMFLPKNTEWEGSFKMQKKILLNRSISLSVLPPPLSPQSSSSPSPSPSPPSLSNCSFSENNPCSEDPEYSFRACVSIWVARKAGCHLDWFRSSSSSYVVIATLVVLVLFGRAAKPLHFNANNALPQRNLSENHPP